MIADSKLIYASDGSYLVVVKNFYKDVVDFDHLFIAHMEGSLKSLYRLIPQHKDVFNGRILFCIKDMNYFGSNSSEIMEGLYEYHGIRG